MPVWLYRAHLGFLFNGRIIAIVHHGRTSGERHDDVTFRVIEPGEALDGLARHELERPRTAKQTLTRMLPGYDFSDASRQRLADEGTIVPFRPA